MKLKQLPEDFRVEEVTQARGEGQGDYAFYRLEKSGWTTPDALAAIRRRWQIDLRRLSYGGLKDRHAVTIQYLTILRGPRRNLTHQRIQLTYLGQQQEPYSSQAILSNRFKVVLRGMKDKELTHATRALQEVQQYGLPNYFDDQRFGSVGKPPVFVAREMVFGRFEEALKLALTAPYEFDRADAKREKAMLLAHWGDWAQCKKLLPRGHARSLVDYLVTHPTDFKGAIARLRPDLQGLYLSAYQSYLWNEMLRNWLYRTLPATSLGSIELKLGSYPVPITLSEPEHAGWSTLLLPLPSARLKTEPEAFWFAIVEEVLGQQELQLAQLRIKGMQSPYFAKGERAVSVRPAHLHASIQPDELNPPFQKMALHFELPRGSYATMVVKRMTARKSSES